MSMWRIRVRCEGARLKLCDRIDTVFLIIWRIRLVGRGRTIGNRVTGNTVPEFESLILRQQNRTPHGVLFCCYELARFEPASRLVVNRVRKRGKSRCLLASIRLAEVLFATQKASLILRLSFLLATNWIRTLPEPSYYTVTETRRASAFGE